MREGGVSLSRSSHSWRAVATASADAPALCGKHTPRLLHVVKEGKTSTTVWQCLICGARFDVVEVTT